MRREREAQGKDKTNPSVLSSPPHTPGYEIVIWVSNRMAVQPAKPFGEFCAVAIAKGFNVEVCQEKSQPCQGKVTVCAPAYTEVTLAYPTEKSPEL